MKTLRSTRYLAVALLLTFSIVTQSACGPGTLSKLHDSLNKAAKSLNVAAKTNRAFYESGTYGVVGSEGAIALRQKGATAIHNANEKLILALTLAQNLTTETFESGKIGVLTALAAAAAELRSGNQTIDVVLQSVALIIQNAVALIQAFQAKDLHRVLPEIRTWKLSEVNV